MYKSKMKYFEEMFSTRRAVVIWLPFGLQECPSQKYLNCSVQQLMSTVLWQ